MTGLRATIEHMATRERKTLDVAEIDQRRRVFVLKQSLSAPLTFSLVNGAPAGGESAKRKLALWRLADGELVRFGFGRIAPSAVRR